MSDIETNKLIVVEVCDYPDRHIRLQGLTAQVDEALDLLKTQLAEKSVTTDEVSVSCPTKLRYLKTYYRDYRY